MHEKPSNLEALMQMLSNVARLQAEHLASEAKWWAQIAELVDRIDVRRLVQEDSHQPIPMRPPGDPNRLLSTREAAEYLRLSEGTLNKWRVTGGGPEYVRIGRKISYRQSALDAFLAGKNFPHTSAYRD